MTLIVLALLTVLAMGLSQMARGSLSDVQLRRDSFDAEVQLKSAGQWTLYQLLTSEADKFVLRNEKISLPINNSALSWKQTEVRIQDAAGLLGLGYYNQDSLKRLLELYLPSQEAKVLAARVGDWIDSDQIARQHGLEAVDYIKAGLPMLPRNGPLRSLDELLEIPGITPELYNGDEQHPGLRDLLMAGGAGYINLATAPAILIGPMMGVDAKAAKAMLLMRQRAEWGPLSQRIQVPDFFGRNQSFTPDVQFRVKLKTDKGYSARAIYRLTPGKPVPYELILWQYPDFNRG